MKWAFALVSVFVGIVMAMSSCGVTKMNMRENMFDPLLVATLEPVDASLDAQTSDDITVSVSPVPVGGDDFTMILTSVETVGHKEITHERLVPIVSDGASFPIFMVKIANNSNHVINLAAGEATGKGTTVIAFVPENGNSLIPISPANFGDNKKAKASDPKMPERYDPTKNIEKNAVTENLPVVGSIFGVSHAKKALNQLKGTQEWYANEFALQQQRKQAREAFNKKFGTSLNANPRVIPGGSVTGYVTFDYDLAQGGNNCEFKVFDLISKVDESGTPVKKASFSWKYKVVKGKASAISGFAGPRMQSFKAASTESAEEQDKAKTEE